MKPVEKLVKEFRCAKCRGNSAVANELSLHKRNPKLPVVGDKETYVFLSCALCGYTEIYNLKVLVSLEEGERAMEAETSGTPVKSGR